MADLSQNDYQHERYWWLHELRRQRAQGRSLGWSANLKGEYRSTRKNLAKLRAGYYDPGNRKKDTKVTFPSRMQTVTPTGKPALNAILAAAVLATGGVPIDPGLPTPATPIAPTTRTVRAKAVPKPAKGAATKQDTTIAMLRRPEGCTVQQVVDATAWSPLSVRGFFSGALRSKWNLDYESTGIEDARVFRLKK